MYRTPRLALAAVTLFAMPAAALAQDGYAAGDSGDTAWLLAASALLLLAALPGLALFYGGRVQAKNLLSMALQCGAVAAIASLLWIVAGYSVAFGTPSSGLVGAGDKWMMIDLGALRPGLTVPESAFAVFKLALAALAPALMVGAWAERARFAWVLGFATLWSLIVFAPVAHWVWGGGWLARLGVTDFAGGLVVLTTAGVSALVAALLVGKRQGFPASPLLAHAPGLAMAGAGLLWVGWLGLAGGSALTATDDAASAIINTHAAACTAALAWLLLERVRHGKPSALGFATGALAGLAAATPAAGFISPGGAIVIGLAATVVCSAALGLVKKVLQVDDTLDVFAVFGVGGMLGALLLAVFASPELGGTGYAEGMDMAGMLGAQAIGVAVVAVYSAIASAICALAISLLWPIRVSEDEERQGLD